MESVAVCNHEGVPAVVMCCELFRPSEGLLRKKRMCRLQMGTGFTNLYYHSRYWEIGLMADMVRV